MRELRWLFLAAALAGAGGAQAQATSAGTSAQPTQRTQPTATQPTQPVQSTEAAQPTQPTQPTQSTQPAQPGFFPPTPGGDPSLFHTLPPEAYANPPAAQPSTQAGAQRPPENAAPPVVVVVPEDPQARAAEVARGQIEAQQALARMRQVPAPINGAFTGATDEADRR